LPKHNLSKYSKHTPLYFITSNEHKFAEAESVLKDCGINICHIRLRYDEARGEKCEEIAKKSAEMCFKRFKTPLFVEDAGLFIPSLNGFPGTYSAWVFKTLGKEGILKLLRGVKDRRAKFISAIAYVDKSGVSVFTGVSEGRITDKIHGKSGFGYDPIFVPNGWKKTYGESDEAKIATSHRMKSLVKFAKWFKRKKK